MKLRLRGRKKPEFKKILAFRLIIFSVLVLFLSSILSAYFNQKIKPVIISVAESRAFYLAAESINKVILKNTENGSFNYENLVNISKNQKGEIVHVSMNSEKINYLQTKIMNDILVGNDIINHSDISIPLGSLLGFTWFSTMGPEIKMDFLSSGRVTAKFIDSIVSAGLNQTKHQVALEFVTEMDIIAPGMTLHTSVNNTVTVAENIIIGEVPNNYGNIRDMLNTQN